MDPLHARYPFLESAREAVAAAEVDLAALIAEGGPPVRRGRERAERALTEGTVEPPGGRRWSTRAELLSYPVGRVLVSLLDTPGAVEKYAAAEAQTAAARFRADLEDDAELRSTRRSRLTLDTLLAEFALDATRPSEDRFAIDVTEYLRLASGLAGDEWRLVNRAVAEGRVVVTRSELDDLLREAVRERIADDLPLDVPDAVADPLAGEVERLEGVLEEVELPGQIDTVAPELFPPCVQYLIDEARGDGELAPHSEFALVGFLVGIGMDAEEVLDMCEIRGPAAAERVRYRVDRLREEGGVQYAPPSCATMQAYGDCVNMDDLCETIAHPMAYYDTALEGAGDVTDWRA